MASQSQPCHHPDAAHLLDYCTASLSAPEAVAIAAHLKFCASCRDTVRDLDTLGGAVLMTAAADRARVPFEPVSARLQEADAPLLANEAEPVPLPDAVLAAMADEGDMLNWTWAAPGIETVPLSRASDGDGASFRSALLRIKAGRAVPAHRHGGEEFTVVLQGGFHDGQSQFLPGDFAFADPEIEHQPIADDDGDCICYVAYNAGLTFTGPVSRWLNWIVRN